MEQYFLASNLPEKNCVYVVGFFGGKEWESTRKYECIARQFVCNRIFLGYLKLFTGSFVKLFQPEQSKYIFSPNDNYMISITSGAKTVHNFKASESVKLRNFYS